jgi:Fic family protein
MMFIISEIHPFLDGNGRLARVMMNAELVSVGESKIIIPTVYREDYILALRKLTRQSEPDTYIRMMERAHTFSENVYGDNRDELKDYLKSCNAFMEDTDGKILQIISRNAEESETLD